jgi:hypothetical protein
MSQDPQIDPTPPPEPEERGPRTTSSTMYLRAGEEKWRQRARWDIRISDADAREVAEQGQPVMQVRGPYASDEERKRDEASVLQSFKSQLFEREVDAYLKGIDRATDRAAARAYQTRSIVLFLVVLAVVAMPLIAILLHLPPADFGTYIAPVTGIAGTVVGYWFGERSQQRDGS